MATHVVLGMGSGYLGVATHVVQGMGSGYLGVPTHVVQGAGALLEVLQEPVDVLPVGLEHVVQQRHPRAQKHLHKHAPILQHEKGALELTDRQNACNGVRCSNVCWKICYVKYSMCV